MAARSRAPRRATRRMLPTNLAFKRMLSGFELTDLAKGKRLKSGTIRACSMNSPIPTLPSEKELTLRLTIGRSLHNASFMGVDTIAHVMQTLGLKVPDRSGIRKGHFDTRELARLIDRRVSVMLPSHLPRGRRFSPEEPIAISPIGERARKT